MKNSLNEEDIPLFTITTARSANAGRVSRSGPAAPPGFCLPPN
jgi:hypothetical protein